VATTFGQAHREDGGRALLPRTPHKSVGVASTVELALSSSAMSIQSILGWTDVTVRISLPDRSGRLRLAVEEGPFRDSGRKRSVRRRTAYEERSVLRIAVPGEPPLVHVFLPILVDARPVGVLEAIAPEAVVTERWRKLLRGARKTGRLLTEVLAEAERRAESRAFPIGSLARDMVRAGSARGALEAVMDFYWGQLGLAAAAWLADGGRSEAVLVGSRGLSRAATMALEGELPTVPRWDAASVEERKGIEAAFSSLTGMEDMTFLHVGEALVISEKVGRALKSRLNLLGGLMADVFGHLATVTWAERRNESLDIGLACTAHEVRGPVIGARAAVDHLLRHEDEPNREFLGLLSQELEKLSEMVESLLAWSVGSAQLRWRRIDLVEVVRGAVQSAEMESGQRRVRISASRETQVYGDAEYLRVAVANVVRNALSYSPAQAEVGVEVRAKAEGVVVQVRDAGPGIAPEERQIIFDPFARGAAGRVWRGGTGLGLFIARRIVEAHGGVIGVESSEDGSAFSILLPTKEAKWQQAYVS
jgi:signal transduction histidine kinase